MQEERDQRARVIARSFGRAVRAARQRANWTQQQLSDHLESYDVRMDTSAITRIENGSRDPRLSEAEAIASALGTPLADLVLSDDSTVRLMELWRRFDAATDELVSAVYNYGAARRALLEGLDDEAIQMLEAPRHQRRPGAYVFKEVPLDDFREAAARGAIRDWSAILHERMYGNYSEEYDHSVFDAEA